MPIYLIIDEYDWFAQELFSKDPERYRAVTGAEGCFKSFYACIKAAATDGAVRTFITGVTFVSLDGVIAGFNIATDITYDADFAGMMGFTDDELRRLIPQVVDLDRYGHTVDEVFDRMKDLYHGYRFSKDSDVTVFNSSMCLYYLSALAKTNAEPRELRDPAFSADTSKIDVILSLSEEAVVKSIVEDVLLDKPIESSGGWFVLTLNASAGFNRSDVLSALVFLGFLTHSSNGSSDLVCPCRAVKELFFRYWFSRFENMQDFFMPLVNRKLAIEALAEGEASPMLELVSQTLSRMAGRNGCADIDETTVLFALAMSLHMSPFYQVLLERGMRGAGSACLILKPNRAHSGIAGWIIDLQNVRKSEATEQVVEAKIAEAEDRLSQYSTAEDVVCIPNLRRAAAVFSGTELKRVKVL